jgi:hypothetical protein
MSLKCRAAPWLLPLLLALPAWAGVIDMPGTGMAAWVIDGPSENPLAYALQGGEPVPAPSAAATLLSEVPTSTWTYGCSATAAGMLFGYYDRHGYSNMYTGPTNGGVAPLTDLGQGDIPASPIAGACSIIATQNGFDGRVTPGHVNDYWVSYLSAGPDPWVGNRPEQAWGGCTADYMGTNQWKWDFSSAAADPGVDANVDGSTTFFFYTNGSPLVDYVPPAVQGLPQTEGCHGLRLFAEAQGYSVVTNFTQLTNNMGQPFGFTYADYMNEINAGRPVLIHVEGHTMTGVGYDPTNNAVWLHDTWDNLQHSMTWGGSYSGMAMWGVSVIQLAPIPEPGTSAVLLLGLAAVVRRRRRVSSTH